MLGVDQRVEDHRREFRRSHKDKIERVGQ